MLYACFDVNSLKISYLWNGIATCHKYQSALLRQARGQRVLAKEQGQAALDFVSLSADWQVELVIRKRS
jgi:hypothetical protein